MSATVVNTRTVRSFGTQVSRVNRFDELVLSLKKALGPSSGLTSDDIDIEFLTKLMTVYDSSDSKWSRYAFGDSSRGYTRNLVDEGNGKSNLVRFYLEYLACNSY